MLPPRLGGKHRSVLIARLKENSMTLDNYPEGTIILTQLGVIDNLGAALE